MSGWEPIETAPKEGRFLIYGTLDWLKDSKAEVHEPSYVYESDGVWRFALDHNGDNGPDYGVATHWMPLPEPPV